MYVATSKQMKAYDQELLKQGYTIVELVDKASTALLPHFLKYSSLAIFCGPGNNGADGVSLAIKLAQRKKKVILFRVVSDFKAASTANEFYFADAIFEPLEIVDCEYDDIEKYREFLQDCDVIVDAMFGFGLHSEPRDNVARMIALINGLYDKEVVAIDIPTGLDCDTGKPYASVVCATKTITITAWKQGFLNEECAMFTGEIALVKMDVNELYEQMGMTRLLDMSWVKYHLKPRRQDSHKGNYGKILHVTGCQQYRGATLLSSRASVYSGSGIVCVCSDEKVIDAVSVYTPECTLMSRPHRLEKEMYNRYDAILLGCGLGLSLESYQYVEDILRHATIPLVIDADALTIISENKDLLKEIQVPVVLTPHLGEFQRFEKKVEMTDLSEQAKVFAKEYGILLVLKGPNTIITDGKEVYRNTTANKAMATAGMGDVLAGMIVSFIGQGYALKEAALIATYLHGRCGDILAKENYTAVASKVIELIPKVMNEVLKNA